MTSYLKSEFYRLFHSKLTYLFIGISSLLLISSNIMLAVVNHSETKFPYATTKFSLGLLTSYFPLLFLLCIMLACMVFGNEYSNHTMKNSISYGISRGSIYFGKLIVEIVYSIISFAIIVGFDFASSYLLLENSGQKVVELFFQTVLVSLPLFLFVLAVTNCFIFIIEGTGGAVSAIIGLLVVVPLVCQLLGMKFEFFRTLGKVLPWNLINNIGSDDKYNLVLSWAGKSGYYNYWIAGILQMLLFMLLGYLAFRKKEVK